MNKFLKYAAIAAFISLVTTTPILAQTSTPKFEIITPASSQTIYGDKVPLLFSVENFQLVDYAQNLKPVAGQGHIHIWLDNQNASVESAIKVIQDTYTFASVAPGQHTLRTELVGNDHKSLNPAQVVNVTFTTQPIPAAQDTSATSGFDKKTAAVILVVVALVIIAAWWYTKEEEETKKPAKKTASKKKRKSAKSRK